MKKISIFFILTSILLFLFFPTIIFASNPYGSAEGAQQYAKEAEAAAAAAAANQTGSSEDLTPVINIKIGQTLLKFEPAKCEAGGTCSIGWLGEYISVIYRYGVGIAAILAVVMIMAGGFLWLVSAGSPDKIGKAKEFITAAFTGLFLALFSFIILNAVNPRLTSIEPLTYRATDEVTLESVGKSEGLNTPSSPSGVRPSNVPLGTNLALVQVPGNDLLNGTRPELSNTMNAMLQRLAQNGTLPAGLQITSGLREDDIGSEHANGTAVDFWWPGIDLDSARAFEREVLGYNDDLNVLTEVRGDPDFQYFRGNGNGVVHIDMRNILH